MWFRLLTAFVPFSKNPFLVGWRTVGVEVRSRGMKPEIAKQYFEVGGIWKKRKKQKMQLHLPWYVNFTAIYIVSHVFQKTYNEVQ